MTQMNPPSVVSGPWTPSEMTQDELSEAVAVLYGEQGVRRLARSLGAYFPEGPRPEFDSATVRKWLTGARPIPLWAERAIADLLLVFSRDRMTDAATATKLAQEILGLGHGSSIGV